MTAVNLQRTRLRKAREALAAAEAQQDMRSSHHVSAFRETESRKGVYHLNGRIESLLEALAVFAKPDDFIAVVGVEDIGWDRALEYGINVDQVAVVRTPTERASQVIGTLLEGFQVVAVGAFPLAPRHQRALASRTRSLRATILSMEPWTGISIPFLAAQKRVAKVRSL